ncbi:MAG: hypothetical protein HY513_04995 [Candidatus Aenigmarchaeota archaeon]|nr:hypothetical protein [Candidatus Aenigmarchaeota archaeon]
MDSITLPMIKLANGEFWIPTQSLGPKILFRATSIRLKGKVSDPSGHKGAWTPEASVQFHAEAEGSVKLRPKFWNTLNAEL